MVQRVALTFDTEHPDRPSEPGGTEAVLSVLAAAGIRATFFIQGRWAEAYPQLARSIAEAGHAIGSHSHYHVRMSLLTEAGVAADIAAAEEAIKTATGVDPRPWFRCPFGDGASDPGLLAHLGAAGYRHVGWQVDALDWAETATAGSLERGVIDGLLAAGDDAIALLHAWPTPTARAVEQIVASGRVRGLEFVGIDELATEPLATVPW